MSGKSGEDPTWHLLLVFVLIFVVSWAVWHFLKTEILEVGRYIRIVELWAMSVFDPRAKACALWLWVAKVGNSIPTPEIVNKAGACFGANDLMKLPAETATQFYNITPASMGVITTLAGKFTRWVAVAVCGALCVHALYFTKRNKFKNRFNLEGFIKTQATVWPVIAPIVKFNPTTHSARAPGQIVPDKLPLFAESLSPEEWLAFHRIPVTSGIPDREMVRRAFLLQLGPRWQGISGLPPHMLGLFAAFSLRGAQKREECETLLGQLALCWTPEKGFQMDPKLAAEVKAIANNPDLGGKALEFANKHAYRTTALLGVLRWARFMGGVLAPAQFLWLRGADRNLWYPLNNLGRRSFHSEGSGAMAHFMAEQAANKPLAMPRIDTAIVALNQYLADSGATVPAREKVSFTKRLIKAN